MWLLKQPEVGAALMSGSGSTVFAVIRDNTDVNRLAKRAKAELDPELWTCAAKRIAVGERRSSSGERSQLPDKTVSA